MIDPHGGTLINSILTDKEISSWNALAPSLPKIQLNARQQSDLEMISHGAFSPLTGFMVEKDYQSVVKDMRLSNGVPWSMPITLDIDPDTAKNLSIGTDISLVDTNGRVVGILHIEDLFKYDKQIQATNVFRTSDLNHPGLNNLFEQKDILVGGTVKLLQHEQDSPYGQYDLKPQATRDLFAKKQWSTVVGFQTRNPIHRAHEYIQKCALETVDGLLVHPLVGETKQGDIPADVRMKCYQVLLDNYYPQDKVALSVMPAFMRYAGPREAILHAIIRKNYGCTHFIVGRDHAGVGDYYGPYDAHYIFDEFSTSELGITPMFFENSFYCNICDAMATNKTCPHKSDAHLWLSGTEVRNMLAAGEMPPPRFTRPEVATILMEAS